MTRAMTREKTTSVGEAPKPRKKLALKKATIRDLETRGRGKGVRGGQSGGWGSVVGPVSSAG